MASATRANLSAEFQSGAFGTFAFRCLFAVSRSALASVRLCVYKSARANLLRDRGLLHLQRWRLKQQRRPKRQCSRSSLLCERRRIAGRGCSQPASGGSLCSCRLPLQPQLQLLLGRAQFGEFLDDSHRRAHIGAPLAFVSRRGTKWPTRRERRLAAGAALAPTVQLLGAAAAAANFGRRVGRAACCCFAAE